MKLKLKRQPTRYVIVDAYRDLHHPALAPGRTRTRTGSRSTRANGQLIREPESATPVSRGQIGWQFHAVRV